MHAIIPAHIYRLPLANIHYSISIMQLYKYSRVNETTSILKIIRRFFSLSFLYDETKLCMEKRSFGLKSPHYSSIHCGSYGLQYHCLGHVKAIPTNWTYRGRTDWKPTNVLLTILVGAMKTPFPELGIWKLQRRDLEVRARGHFNLHYYSAV